MFKKQRLKINNNFFQFLAEKKESDNLNNFFFKIKKSARGVRKKK